VLQGIPPAALSKVSSDSLRELITTCIAHDPQQRPSAVQLLKNAFFADLAGAHLPNLVLCVCCVYLSTCCALCGTHRVANAMAWLLQLAAAAL
jgi:serine/threonine protein kinase